MHMGNQSTSIETPVDEAGQAEETTEGAEEETDGATDEAAQEGDDAQSEQAGDAGADGGAGTGEAGEDGEAEEAAAGPAEGEDQPLTFTRSQFDQAVAEAVKKHTAAAPAAPAPAPRELSEEEWAKKEEEWGVGRSTIKQVATMATSVYQQVMAAVQSEMAPFKRDIALTGLSREPGFADVGALRSGIEQFLERVPGHLHNDMETLKTAAIYARGLQANKRVAQVRSAQERNRRIVTKTRPASPTGKRTHSVRLTPIQRDAARFHPGGEAGYIKDLAGRGKPIG
jgi:hypothetical protein